MGPEHPYVANSLHGLGRVAESRGDYPTSLDAYQRAMAIDERALGSGHADMAIYLTDLADVRQHLAQGAQALEEYRRAVTIAERALGPDHPDVAEPLTGLASLLVASGRAVDALDPARRAVEIREAHAGDAIGLATSRFALARALWGAGRERPRAVALARQARDAYQAAGPQASAALATVTTWLSSHAVD
jgi:tetratricopeptide (TPR) repeat protein